MENKENLKKETPIDWDAIENKLCLEVFEHTPGIGYETIKREFEYPNAIMNWLKSNIQINRWIDVNDEIPPIHQEVLVYDKNYEIGICYLKNDGNWVAGNSDFFKDYIETQWNLSITHWMPLPPNPTQTK